MSKLSPHDNNAKKVKLTVLDVGSNKGQSVDFFLKINADALIFGFEPNSRLYKNLITKYQGNSNIVFINNGVSSKEGKLLFQENIMDETSTFEKLNYESDYLKKKARALGVSPENIIVNKYEVKVITLGSFLNEHKDLAIDVLKIDVEGHEYDCLLGLFDGSRSDYPILFLQLEEHKDDMYENNHDKEILELLDKNGFTKVASIKHGFGDFYEGIYENTRLK